MPSEQDIIEAARFEYGIRPDETRLSGSLMSQVTDEDPLDRQEGVSQTAERMENLIALRELRRMQDAGSEAFKRARRELRQLASMEAMGVLARMVQSPRGFRERLFAFWLDHFTVSPKGVNQEYLLGAYHQEAIRPFIATRFSDMLKAVISHPSMLLYLDQIASIGPNSAVGQRRGKGLNENLAREVLELYTLGVGAPYTQRDVRQFAELLTGLRLRPEGMHFATNIAEPGAEQILGQSYGGDRAKLEDIFEFLDDLAMMPATAMHLARKLVEHFIGKNAPPTLASEMAAAYLAFGGMLTAFYEVLLAHRSAHEAVFTKVRPPFEYVATVLRALDFDANLILSANISETRKLGQALLAMGQRPFKPTGPDGWPEAAESWITPPQLAARISWAGQAARKFAADRDPRDMMRSVLGDRAPEFLSFAVSGAETKWEGVALLLVSPSLMRR